jgi:hypothetical protein
MEQCFFLTTNQHQQQPFSSASQTEYVKHTGAISLVRRQTLQHIVKVFASYLNGGSGCCCVCCCGGDSKLLDVLVHC